MPLVTLVAKGKTWDDATFAEAMQDWDVTFMRPKPRCCAR